MFTNEQKLPTLLMLSTFHGIEKRLRKSLGWQTTSDSEKPAYRSWKIKRSANFVACMHIVHSVIIMHCRPVPGARGCSHADALSAFHTGTRVDFWLVPRHNFEDANKRTVCSLSLSITFRRRSKPSTPPIFLHIYMCERARAPTTRMPTSSSLSGRRRRHRHRLHRY